jgi:PRTRC genetic system protein E
MFIELMPLIQNRPLTITVSALSEGGIRVNVVPQSLAKDSKANEKIGYAHKDKIAQIPESAIHALTVPLSLSGTPEEIDAELAQRLKAFVDSHMTLRQSVEEARQQIAEAVKAIEERDKARSKPKAAPAKADEKPSDAKGGEEAKLTADNLSLFDPRAVTA